MTEDDYIYCQDLATIRAAKATLRNIVPNCNDLIDSKEFTNIMRTLRKWEIAHNKEIKVE